MPMPTAPVLQQNRMTRTDSYGLIRLVGAAFVGL